MFLTNAVRACCNIIMKTFHSLRVCLLSWALLASPSAIAHATVMSLGTVEQPVNLCAAADPSRIPLGPVAVESNHGYGIHEVIVAPRPCQHGAMTWKGGLELNQNLASAFGISLEIEDDTQIHEGTVLSARPRLAFQSDGVVPLQRRNARTKAGGFAKANDALISPRGRSVRASNSRART